MARQIRRRSQLTAISLFTGAGGLDLGFEAAGFNTTVGVEMDSRCCETLRRNRAWPILQADAASITTGDMLSTARLVAGEPDVLIGGPPCQPFSKSGFWATGDAKRLDDPRASTIETYMRVLAEAQPRAFLLENVEGLGFRGKDEGLQLIHARLASINRQFGTNYRASVGTLNAADFGVPQLRRRMFVIGSRDGAPFIFPPATHQEARPDNPQCLPRHRTAWDALYDLPEPVGAEVKLKGKWSALLPTIPEGGNYLWHTDRGGGEPLFGWRRRYWSFLLKLAKDQPSWTIQAQPGPATGPFHWNNRRLTMREMARLQTFPDDIVVCGTLPEAQRQLGNAVPALLGEVIARAIATQLLGRSSYSGQPRLGLDQEQPAPPRPARPKPVPKELLSLRGSHDAHPGTGKGRRAAARQPARTAA